MSLPNRSRQAAHPTSAGGVSVGKRPALAGLPSLRPMSRLMVGPALGLASERCHALAAPVHRPPAGDVHRRGPLFKASVVAARQSLCSVSGSRCQGTTSSNRAFAALTSAVLAPDATLRQYGGLCKLTSLDFLPRCGCVMLVASRPRRSRADSVADYEYLSAVGGPAVIGRLADGNACSRGRYSSRTA